VSIVELDEAPLLDRLGYGGVGLVIQISKGPDPWETIGEWAGQMAAADPEIEWWGPVQIRPDSFVVSLGPTEAHRLLHHVRRLQRSLSATGCSGRVGLHEPPAPPFGAPGRLTEFHSTTIVASLPVRSPRATAAGGRSRSVLDIDPDTREGVLRHAVDWCGEAEGRWVLSSGPGRVEVDSAAEIRPTIDLFWRRPYSTTTITRTAWPGDIRTVTVDSRGLVFYACGRGDHPVAAGPAREAVERALRGLAPWATYGFGLRTFDRQISLGMLTRHWVAPRVPIPDLDRPHRLPWRRAVDAFPVQYIGPDFPSLDVGSRFIAERLESGGVLLTADRADRWLDAPPSPDELAPYRAALAPWLMTPAHQ
jgi:hypothetical protein